MTNRARGYYEFTGGGDQALDSVDGAVLVAGDLAFVLNGGNLYTYRLDATSGYSETSPYYIVPDTNAGSKSWVLQGGAALVTESVFIPIGDAIDGTAAPDAAAAVTSGNGKVMARTFAGDSSEDVIIPWAVPPDIYLSDGIKYQVVCVVTAATGPSAEGVVFSLSGYCVGSGDALGGTFGAEVLSSKTAMTEDQYDIVITDQSGKVTISDLAAGELAELKLYRDHDHADDTYVQLIGVIGIHLEYTRLMKR